jgi:hypothetical protein
LPENGRAVGTPYIAIKDYATAAAGALMAKRFHFYNLNRDEFLAHYHKRSNVGSTNAMIKAKFGDHIRSKTDTAMVNEALATVLCHNRCCLIQSHYELGINATFWGEEDVVVEPTELVEFDQIEALAWIQAEFYSFSVWSLERVSACLAHVTASSCPCRISRWPFGSI